MLKGADWLSVRSKTTHSWLMSADVKCEMHPDLAHFTSEMQGLGAGTDIKYLTRERFLHKQPANKLWKDKTTSLGRWVFHSNSKFWQDSSVQLHQFLHRNPDLVPQRLVIVVASPANHHDNVVLMKKFSEDLSYKMGSQVIFHMSQDYRETVSILRASDLFLSTSLHFNIVASSYSIPTVALMVPKTIEYVRTWMPNGSVPIEDLTLLSNAINIALRVDNRLLIDESRNLRQLVRNSLNNMKKILNS